MQKYPTGSSVENQFNHQSRKFGDHMDREKFIRTDYKIRNKYCRLIEQGQPPREMPTREALELAQEQGLNLIEIGYDRNADCSLVKIADFGKYQYERKMKEKLAKKQARANRTELKTCQISLTTDTADLERIVGKAKAFLQDGDQVKLSLRFRGRREMMQQDLAKTTMKNVLSRFDGIAILDSAPQLNGKELSCILRAQKK
jgi:translation initiation factor IF-3